MPRDSVSMPPLADTDLPLPGQGIPLQPLADAAPLPQDPALSEDSVLSAETAPTRERIRSDGGRGIEVIAGLVVAPDLPVQAQADSAPAAPGLLAAPMALIDDIAAPAGRLLAAPTGSERAIASHAIPSDTLFPNQWHLENTGQSGGVPGLDLNVTRVWDEFSGAGVTVGIWDDGIEYTHHDLNDNYDTSLHITVGALLHDPFPENSNSMHGTAVAGLIAAENNGTGTVGVAWGATIAGVDMFEDATLDFENSFLELDNFDITNHSWGFTTPFDANILNTGWTTFFAGWLESVETGRGGLGTINVKSAGNDRTDGRDANDSSLNNIPQTIAVAAISHDNNVSWYSTPGAAVLIAAPSNGATGAGMWTTDRTGAVGYSNGTNQAGNTDADYTSSFGGTSSAAPVTAGVVALMLEANPDLGWRDVQTILASTARHVGSAIGAAPAGNELYTWTVNGATTWNGGGMHFSNDYGYGLVDALAAVRLAESWTLQSTSANWQQQVAATWTGDLIPPDNDIVGISFDLDVTADIDLEHVGLQLGWGLGPEATGAYLVTLTSPDGTSSILSRPQNNGDSVTGTWLFESNQFRGEVSVGTWTVHVADLWAGFTESVTSAQLILRGAAQDADDIWIFTNEFGDLAGGAHGHTTAIADTNGGSDTLNAAAVTLAAVIDLGAGTGQIDGVAVTLSGIEHAVTGDGDDWLRGDAGANSLSGGRGADTLDGGAGADTLAGGQGNDLYVVDAAGDVVVETATGGVDTVHAFGSHTLALHVENLVLIGTGNVNGAGNAGNNSLTGNAAANALFGMAGTDTLFGGAGNDTLNGGTGADIMVGGAGNDVYVVDHLGDSITEAAGGGIDLVQSALGYTLGVHVERLVLTGSANVSGTGNALDNILSGNAGNNVLTGFAGDDALVGAGGNDTLQGGLGNDTLNAGAGADSMVGGLGDDLYVVDNGGDVVVENAGEGTDMVQSFVNYTLGANLENLQLIGTANVNGAGNSDANTLTGNTGNNQLFGLDGNDMLFGGQGDDTLGGGLGDDTLNGGAGADSMVGGAGNDTYVVGDGGDIVVEGVGGGTDTVQSLVSHTLVANVENLTLTGAGNINGAGNADANVLTGGNGNNALFGLDGNDTLAGGLGIDTLAGGLGADHFVFGSAAEVGLGADSDRITDFLSGTDKVHLAGLGGALSFIGAAAFSGAAGQLRYSVAAGTGTLEGDLDGNSTADFALLFTNGTALLAGDLIL